jgi:hypothetical protein
MVTVEFNRWEEKARMRVSDGIAGRERGAQRSAN